MTLRVQDLYYSYGAKRALDGVTLNVTPGVFCALLGPNGAGKSTLFSILTRLFTPQKGRVEIAGHDLSQSPLSALAQIGVVFQQSTLDLDLTVYRNLKYFAAIQGLRGLEADTRIQMALEQLSMSERASEPVRALNGGHRRRAELARALLHRPSVLLLDEPTIGLDAESRAAITDHVHRLATEEGLVVLWATHLTDEIRDQDQLVILHHGRILADAPTSSITEGRPLTETFLAMTGAET